MRPHVIHQTRIPDLNGSLSGLNLDRFLVHDPYKASYAEGAIFEAAMRMGRGEDLDLVKNQCLKQLVEAYNDEFSRDLACFRRLLTYCFGVMIRHQKNPPS